ncbi:MAG TPA: hypothetical protein EYP48_02920 [Ignisphaera sp.]|nr:hypothetical protein [Ignisphaera sp.]
MHQDLQILVIRKVIHFSFSLLLILPLTPSFIEASSRIGITNPTLFTYSLLTFFAALVNSIQIRKPNLREEMIRFLRDLRKRSLAKLESLAKSLGTQTLLKIGFEELDKLFSRAEENLNTIVSRLERDYEKQYGYVCITFALISILLAYILFDKYVIYGILALAIVDSVSAIFTALIPTPKIYKHSVPSMIISFVCFYIPITMFSGSPIKSLAISAIVILIETISPEDNLTLPFLTALISYYLAMPIPLNR